MHRRSNSAERPARHLTKQSSWTAGQKFSARSTSPGFARPASLAAGPSLRRRLSSQLAGIPGSTDICRWDGPERTTSSWDGLRRDAELWVPDGDCLVHLYGRGLSRRGPSFRIPFSAVTSANCLPLLERYSAHSPPESPLSDGSGSSSENGGYFGNPTSSRKHDLYIPAPPHCSRDESYRYHLNTRNFFAWMLRKPIVGAHLGKAMVDLLERMDLFRSEDQDNLEDLLDYLDEEEYTDFRDCPDYALAGLYFAEHFRLRAMWTDAIVHCTGMNERLISSTEFEPVSRVSKALITRAKLEMDIRIENCGHQLSGFLDNELSGTYLGLGHGARGHLDRFRSFLHGFYVGKFGYWPPGPQSGGASGLNKNTFRSMYFEFRNLYEYLVDNQSTNSLLHNVRPVNGGICVLQNITAFDKRNLYMSLPHPLPLLPEGNIPVSTVAQKRRSFVDFQTRRFTRSFSKSSAKPEKKLSTLAALFAATNTSNASIMGCGLVRAYTEFEKECTLFEEDKVSAVDARKVRWILVYGMLQTLISVTRAPPEVRDPDNVTYHLCSQVAGTPPWQTSSALRARRPVSTVRESLNLAKSSPTSASPHRSSVNIPHLPSPMLSSTPSPAIRPDSDLLFANWDSQVPHPHASVSSSPISTADEAYLSSLPPTATPPIPLRRSHVDRHLSVIHPQPLRPGYHDIIVRGFDEPSLPLAVPRRSRAREARSSGSAADMSSPPSSSPEVDGEKKESRWSGSTESSEYSASPSSSSGASFADIAPPSGPEPSGGSNERGSAPRKGDKDWRYQWEWSGEGSAGKGAGRGDLAAEASVVVVRQQSVDGFGTSPSNAGW